ncbi:MAG: peptide deformylase [Patescibacteria group bacterium]
MIRDLLQQENAKLKALNTVIDDFNSSKLSRLISDLIDTMHAAQLIGMAAPQIGQNYTVFVTELRETKYRTKDQTDELRVYVNPRIVSSSKERVVIYEGCGSVESVACFGPVSRPREITIEAFDAKGKKFRLTCDGILSRVIQHEYDHLQGIEFIDKIEDKSTLVTQEKYISEIKNSHEQLEASKITKVELQYIR